MIKREALLVLLFSGLVFGEIIPVEISEPVPFHYGHIIRRLREIPTHAERVEFLRQEKAKEQSSFFQPKNPDWADNVYRRFRNMKFQWQCTAGETGPFTVEVSETPDFEDAMLFVGYRNWSKGTWYPEYPVEAYYNSFKIGTKYYWRVNSYNLKAEGKPVRHSAVSTFVTEALPPRHILLENSLNSEGRRCNFRDIGGWQTTDGSRVRQGLAYRSQAFNDTSSDTIHPGRSRIGIADRQFLLETLKLKTEIDLRSPEETANATSSVLGLRYLPLPIPAYAGAFTPSGMEQIGKVFHALADSGNYPLVFHCVGGADRTATLAILLNGLLGVSEHELACDWESTFLPDLPCLTRHCKSRCCSIVFSELAKYGQGNDSLVNRIEAYLLKCGVTTQEFTAIRELLLEPQKP